MSKAAKTKTQAHVRQMHKMRARKLYKAVIAGKHALALSLIHESACDQNRCMQQSDGSSSLHQVVRHRQAELLAAMCQMKRNTKNNKKKKGFVGFTRVDLCDARGFTPLAIAVRQGWSHAVELLLRCGADPCYSSASIASCDIVASTPYCTTALHEAVRYKQVDLLKLMLEHKQLDVDVCNEIGYTPLGIAAQRDWTNGVKLLVQHGADPDIQMDVGRGAYTTPLLLACEHSTSSNAVQAMVQGLIDPQHSLACAMASDTRTHKHSVQFLRNMFKTRVANEIHDIMGHSPISTGALFTLVAEYAMPTMPANSPPPYVERFRFPVETKKKTVPAQTASRTSGSNGNVNRNYPRDSYRQRRYVGKIRNIYAYDMHYMEAHWHLSQKKEKKKLFRATLLKT